MINATDMSAGGLSAVAAEEEVKRLRRVKAALHIRLMAKEQGWDPQERDDLLDHLGLKNVKGKT